MRTITTEELKEANRKALAENTLTAQAPRPRCVYILQEEGKIYRCAIGCALTEKELSTIHPNNMDQDLRNAPSVAVRFEDPEFAFDLQFRHDQWCYLRNVSVKNRYMAMVL